jgi:type I restriction enzyme S subunit
VNEAFNLVELIDVCELVAGQSPPSSTYNNDENGVPFFQGKADFGQLYPTVRMWCSEPKKISLPGDILMSVRAPVGSTNINNVMACIGRGLSAIRCSSKIEQRFLLHYLRFNEPKIADMGTGSTFKAITQKELRSIKIPLPPLAEQQKIAEILDAADSLRQKDQQLVNHYTTLSQSLFLEMFGDPVTNPMGWEKPKLGSLIKIERGGSPRPISEFLGGSYPWIKIGDATKGNDIYLEKTKEHIIREGLAKTRLLPAGSIIFANCGVSLGFARIITFEGCIHDGWLSFSEIDENVLNKIFILKVLNSITEYFRNTAPDGTQPNLNTSIMKGFEFMCPPISLQNQFVERIQAIEAQKQQAEASLEKSNDLFNSLLQRAFNGELTGSKAA